MLLSLCADKDFINEECIAVASLVQIKAIAEPNSV